MLQMLQIMLQIENLVNKYGINAGFNDVFISALCCSRNRWSCTNEENIASEQLHITYENKTTL